MTVSTSRREGAPVLRVVIEAARTFAESALVVVALGSLVFFALRLLPGDPALLVLGDHASLEERAQLNARLHLDEPLGVQFLRFLSGLVRFNLGDSLRHPGTPAFSRVAASFRSTATLALLSVALGAVSGVTLALLGAGPWLGTARHRVRAGLDALASVPLLSFAPLMTYLFAVRLRLVPLPGDPDERAAFSGLLFAASLLAIPLGAHLGRTALALLQGMQGAPFMRVACAKGASPLRVWLLHALPTVSGPLITIVSTQLGALLGGAVVLERLFERPGLGLLVLEAYASRDLPVLEAAILSTGALFVAVQTLGALLGAWIDPRGRAR
jgi:peptide/nickel transport system permease protein